MEKNLIAKKIIVGAGIAAAAVGAYFIYGAKDAAKNRKKVKAWMLYAKGEIMEKLENLSEINEEIYKKIVSEVSEKYQTLKSIDKEDVLDFMDDLKARWKSIAKDAKSSAKKSANK